MLKFYTAGDVNDTSPSGPSGGDNTPKRPKKTPNLFQKITSGIRAAWRGGIAPLLPGMMNDDASGDLATEDQPTVSTRVKRAYKEEVGRANGPIARSQTLGSLLDVAALASDASGDLWNSGIQSAKALTAYGRGDAREAKRIMDDLTAHPDYSSSQKIGMGGVMRNRLFDEYLPAWGNDIAHMTLTNDAGVSKQVHIPVKTLDASLTALRGQGWKVTSSQILDSNDLSPEQLAAAKASGADLVTHPKTIPAWVPFIGNGTAADVLSTAADIADPVSGLMLKPLDLVGDATKIATKGIIRGTKADVAVGKIVSKAVESKVGRWAAPTINRAIDTIEDRKNGVIGTTIRAITKDRRTSIWTKNLKQRALESNQDLGDAVVGAVLSNHKSPAISAANTLVKQFDAGGLNVKGRRIAQSFKNLTVGGTDAEIELLARQINRISTTFKKVGPEKAKEMNRLGYALADADAGKVGIVNPMDEITGDTTERLRGYGELVEVKKRAKAVDVFEEVDADTLKEIRASAKKIVRERNKMKGVAADVEPFGVQVDRETMRLLKGNLSDQQLAQRAGWLSQGARDAIDPTRRALPAGSIDGLYDTAGAREHYARIERLAGKAGLDMQDVQAVADAKRVLGAKGNYASVEIENITSRFGNLLDGVVPEEFLPKADDIAQAGAVVPSLDLVRTPTKARLVAGLNMIGKARDLGLDPMALEYMRDALRTLVSKEARGDFDEIVTKFVDNELAAEAGRIGDLATGITARGAKKMEDLSDWLGRIDKDVIDQNLIGPKVRLDIAKTAAAERASILARAEEMGLDPDTLSDMAALARRVDEDYGKLQVKLGYLKPEQFEQMRGLHVRHLYSVYDLPEAELRGKIDELAGSDSVLHAQMTADYDRLLQRQATLERRGAKARRNAAATDLKLAREGVSGAKGGIEMSGQMTRENVPEWLRQAWGEREYLSDAFTLSGKRAVRNISLEMFYRSIAFDETLAQKARPGAGWFELRGSHWGALEGKFVPAQVANDLDYMSKAFRSGKPEGAIAIWQKFVKNMKFLQTAAYYKTQLANMWSNQVMMEGKTGIGELDRALYGAAAVRELMEHGPEWRKWANYSPSASGVNNLASELGDQLVEDGGTGLGRFANKVIHPFSRAASRTMSNAETHGKMTIFLYAKRKLGLSDAQAAVLAERTLFDYADVPPIINWLRRNSVLPYITYTYKVAGDLVKNPVNRPGTFLNQLRKFNSVERATPEEVRQIEEAGRPDYMVLPVRQFGKESRYFDLANFLPWGAIDWASEDDGMPLALRGVVANLGSPFKNLVEIAANRSLLTGMDLVPEGTSPGEAAAIRRTHLAEMLPQYPALRRFVSSLRGVPADPMRKGVPQTWYDAITGARNLDIERGAEVKFNSLKREYDAALRIAGQYAEGENWHNDPKAQQRIKEQLAHAEQIGKKMQTVLDDSVTIPHLADVLVESGADHESAAKLARWIAAQQMMNQDDYETYKSELQNGGFGAAVVRRMGPAASPGVVPPVGPTPHVDMRSQRPNGEVMGGASKQIGAGASPLPAIRTSPTAQNRQKSTVLP